MELKERFWFPVIIFICVLYVLLRLWNLTDTCLWFDEIFSIHAAEHDWQNLFSFVASDLIHPPFFYVLLKIWIAAVGENLFWLRLFPVLFSTAALVPFYLICRQLKIDFPAIALALSLFAASGALIKYAQEIRMYAVLLCLSLFSLWLFLRFFNLGKSFALLTIANVLLVYTHYFGWLVVVSEIAAILIFQRIKIRQILIMSAITLSSFTPWIFAVWQASMINADFSQNLGWANKPNLLVVFQFVFDLIEPFYYQQTNIDKSSIFLITVPLLLILIVASAFYLLNRKNQSEIDKRSINLLLIFVLTPVIFAFVASWALPVSVWGTRHLIIVFAPFLILTAIVIDKIKILYLKLAVLALIFWLTGIAFLIQLQRGTPLTIVCAWENLAGDLERTESTSGERAKIFVFEDLAAYDFWFALRKSANKFQVVKVNNIPGLAEDAAYFLPRGFDAVEKTDENGLRGERFFIAFRDTEWNETKPPLRNLTARGYKLDLRKTFEAQGTKAFLAEVIKK
ncbi:MAG TPA: glycosyltransferase family 39 protein [Pyrinomonadaceae bacterium]|nr:glycosyltransferase family 39 protein [Pyrinomonadaceae bacterium]